MTRLARIDTPAALRSSCRGNIVARASHSPGEIARRLCSSFVEDSRTVPSEIDDDVDIVIPCV